MNKEVLAWNNKKNLKMVVNDLKEGGVILGTSDTVFGLLAMVNDKAVAALNKLKGRAEKPYIVLIGDKSRILDFTGALVPAIQSLVANCWPGPLTLILEAKEGLPAYARGTKGTVALRVPSHAGLLVLLQDIPALFSTSANKAGSPVPGCLADVDPEIVRQVSAIILDHDAHAGCTSVVPSTIIDCTGPRLKVVREGAYAIDTLEAIAGQKFLRS